MNAVSMLFNASAHSLHSLLLRLSQIIHTVLQELVLKLQIAVLPNVAVKQLRALANLIALPIGESLNRLLVAAEGLRVWRSIDKDDIVRPDELDEV